MKLTLTKSAVAALVSAVLASPASAQNTQGEVFVFADIAGSTTWTANNTYNLQKQIYVLPGATLTIEAGTVIASTTGLGGSLAVSKGGQIYVQGTKNNPVIMTSKDDMNSWIGGNPQNAVWRETANEWGNLTIMGAGYISEDATAGNVPTPNANNVAAMEGLVAAFPGDPKVLYGGGNDDDNSGTLNYLSIRYGGKVIGLNNELNGLSLGGIGRGTDISHVEIMNNVDDGIEIWGGTVNVQYASVWNIGDDSFDIDQGWRGKAQHIFIVQGASLDASQGSGVGDNAFETDGAEQSDWQPVTSTVIYNATVLGQPIDGDGLTTWRDNARVQYRNCIFMDGGDEVVRWDNLDGDGGLGYGHNGTTSWAATWTSPYNAYSTVNAPANPADFYQAQVDGNLAEIKDSVLFNNTKANAYSEFNARGANAAGNNNVIEPAGMPIKGLTRGANIVRGGKVISPVTNVDPRPAADALTSVGMAPNDGFFTTGVKYRGAFNPANPNWLSDWSAADAMGFLAPKSIVTEMRVGSNVIANLVVDQSVSKATVVYQGAVLCDEAPISVIGGKFTFTCGAFTVQVSRVGGQYQWAVPSLGKSGPLKVIDF